MSDDIDDSQHKIRELEQEKAILTKINKSLENTSKITREEKDKFSQELDIYLESYGRMIIRPYRDHGRGFFHSASQRPDAGRRPIHV